MIPQYYTVFEEEAHKAVFSTRRVRARVGNAAAIKMRMIPPEQDTNTRKPAKLAKKQDVRRRRTTSIMGSHI